MRGVFVVFVVYLTLIFAGLAYAIALGFGGH
jgi:hypothetical protein